MKRAYLLDETPHGGSSAVVAWPEHAGVEGLSISAARAQDDDGTAVRALAALDAWLPASGSDAADADLVPSVRADAFPYGAVLAHYQGVGRTHAAAALIDRLREMDDRLQRPEFAGEARLWPLAEWLPSTIDQETGNYDSYVVARLLESPRIGGPCTDDPVPGSHAEAEDATDARIDALLGALAADLARIEADALRVNPSPSQLQRTRGCLVLLSRLAELSPKWAERPDLPATPAGSRSDDRSDGIQLAETTARLAAEVWERAPGPCRQAVELSMLPATPLHDELMFIRSIQVFETLYRQIYRCLVRANVAVQAGEVSRARAELDDAVGRLELSPVLYRVVTTMPRAAFAVIREYTHGRSAIQSRAYRQIHLVCAPQPPNPFADKLPAVEVPTPSLQESFLALAARLDTPEVAELAGQMRALDTSWRAMKRTHWGVTLKIIGKVPGTGGTTGADYLKQAAEIPLFPELAAR